MSEQETTAKFLPHGVEVTKSNLKTGVKSTKLVDYNSFFEAINQNIILQTGLIPPGTRFFSRHHGEVIIMMEEPPRIEEMAFSIYGKNDKNTLKGQIPTPGVLIGARLKEGHGITHANVWFLKQSIKTIDDPVYHCPLGNTYMRNESGEHNFCWGNTTNMWKNIQQAHQLRSLVNIFYTSRFNSDLSPCHRVPADLTKEKIDTIEGLWQYIIGKKDFPTTVLMEAGTFKSAIKTLENKDHNNGDIPF